MEVAGKQVLCSECRDVWDFNDPGLPEWLRAALREQEC